LSGHRYRWEKNIFIAMRDEEDQTRIFKRVYSEKRGRVKFPRLIRKRGNRSIVGGKRGLGNPELEGENFLGKKGSGGKIKSPVLWGNWGLKMFTPKKGLVFTLGEITPFPTGV